MMRVTMVAMDRSGVGARNNVGGRVETHEGGPDFSGVQGPAFSVSGPDHSLYEGISAGGEIS